MFTSIKEKKKIQNKEKKERKKARYKKQKSCNKKINVKLKAENGSIARSYKAGFANISLKCR